MIRDDDEAATDDGERLKQRIAAQLGGGAGQDTLQTANFVQTASGGGGGTWRAGDEDPTADQPTPTPLPTPDPVTPAPVIAAPTDTRSDTVYDDTTGVTTAGAGSGGGATTGGAHNQAGNTRTKQQFLQETIASGVSREEAQRTADYIYGTDGNATAGATTGAAAAGSGPEAEIDALFAKYGVTDGGEGSGFRDRAYWLRRGVETGDWAYMRDRLDKNLGGTGVDTGYDAKGVYHTGGGDQHTPKNLNAGIQAPTTTGLVAAPTGTDALYQPSGTQTTTGTSAWTDQIRQQLLERIRAAGEPVNETSSGIAGAVTAMRDENSRGMDKERTALAEHLYGQGGGGLDTNALNQGIQQSNERATGAQASLRANLIMKEVQSRRAELQGYLQMALQSGDSETARSLQLQLANLDATLRREGMGVDMGKYSAYLNAMASQNVTGP